MRKRKYSYAEIGKALGRDGSAIWYEIIKNRTAGKYHPKKAQHKAYVRRKYAKYQGMKIIGHTELKKFVNSQLLAGQSPEDVAGRLKKKREKKLPFVSKDSIYRYLKSVYGRRIEAKLLKKKQRKRKRARSISLDGRIFIDKRPNIINARMRIGDAEADFIVSGKSGKGILVVVVDRKSRASFLEPIWQANINNVHRALRLIRKRFPEWRTMTTDNDLLFQKHKSLEKELNVKIFFCHPYHSWEKGTVENTNGEIRKDLPKGSDISQYSGKFFKNLEEKLNSRFMKCLSYQTPAEVLKNCRKQKRLRYLRRKGK